MKNVLVRLIFVCSLVFFAGCATQRVDWSARVGSYSFDQAVLDLGLPDKQARLTDGTVVAEWMTRRGYRNVSPTYGYGGYHGWSQHGPPFPPLIETQTPDYFLRLTFGPDGKLSAWKNFAR